MECGDLLFERGNPLLQGRHGHQGDDQQHRHRKHHKDQQPDHAFHACPLSRGAGSLGEAQRICKDARGARTNLACRLA